MSIVTLVSQLTEILEKAGLKPGGFFRQDMSRQTKKENAFLAGLGKTRRVVMADNLLEHMSEAEISSVIAHEVGHYKYSHLPKNILIGTAQQLITFYLLDLVMKNLFPEFLTSNAANLALFPMIGLIMSILSGFLFGPLNNWLSRYFEHQAEIIGKPMARGQDNPALFSPKMRHVYFTCGFLKDCYFNVLIVFVISIIF